MIQFDEVFVMASMTSKDVKKQLLSDVVGEIGETESPITVLVKPEGILEFRSSLGFPKSSEPFLPSLRSVYDYDGKSHHGVASCSGCSCKK